MSRGFLDGRVAWVTGGVSGLGRAIALALAEAGADVAIGSLVGGGRDPSQAYTHRSNADELAAVLGDIEGLGVRAFAQALDVRFDDSVAAFFGTVLAELGPVDILVNAAGVSAQVPLAGHDDETWRDVLATNLDGPYRTIKRCLPGMIERGWGRIVNIASTAANVGHAEFAAYCASKAGLLGLTRCVALEGAPHGVTCNAVNPGFVDTALTRMGSVARVEREGLGKTVEQNLSDLAETYPQKRLIEAGEIAALVVFLCRDEALGMTMEDITVSGGALW